MIIFEPMKNFGNDSVPALFLDRDGVINRKIDGDYVRDLDSFEILPGVLEAVTSLSDLFDRIFIVTNQQGVGKGLMSAESLEVIHAHLASAVSEQGGRIDAIYHAPQLASENSPFRKPGTGMALQAKEEFPEIDLGASTMVGDSLSDMQFGRALEMTCVFIGKPEDIPADYYDSVFDSLHSFARHIAQQA